MSDENQQQSGNEKISHRNSARIAAVQALYEIDVTGAPTDNVLSEFMTHRWKGAAIDDNDAPIEIPSFDTELLKDIIEGVSAGQVQFDAQIAEELSGVWTMERLELLIRAILRAGTYELTSRIDIPKRVVINEYVNVAHAFFVENEPSMVNGVLDKLAQKLRKHED
jgi:transcription antitermination protein NusB